MARPPPRVFTISPGAPFLATFVEAFIAGRVAPGVGADPAILAGATIFVPTRRSARALAEEFARALNRSVVLLPKIVPLGRLEDIETSLAFDEVAAGDFSENLPDAVGDVERRLVLTRLVLEWARRLRGAIVSIDASGKARLVENESLLVATSPAQAWQLSGDLAALIDDMTIEGVPWEALSKLAPEAFDDYWRITLEFLKIAIGMWPGHLAARGLVDAAERQKRLVDMEIARLEASGDARPVVAIGSTGANPATARLLGAIARQPAGAIVLPGLDLGLDDAAWSLIPGDAARRADPADGHPQAMLFRLLKTLGVARADVIELGTASAELARRARLVGEAMRPAEATEGWRDWFGEARGSFASALAGVTLIEAADEREEALCLAIEARRLLERDGATGALVTPNRNLALRVRGELARWNVEVDDSGGESLALTPAGVLARLVLAAAAPDRAPLDCVALLAHPLARPGFEAAELRRLAELAEIGVWRGVPAGDLDTAAAVEMARLAAQDRDAHPAARAMSDEDWDLVHDLLDNLDAAMAPLRVAPPGADLAVWGGAHRQALARVTGLVAAGEEDSPLADFFETFARSDIAGLSLTFADYVALFEQMIAEAVVRAPRRGHPRFKILGPLEARLLHADVFLLGGLDETVWPPAASVDPFLNRPMRAALGLDAPERRIGQTAHDFTQALGAPLVVVSRARKRGGSPTVPSRFLQRIAALAGENEWRACRDRGEATIALARALDATGEAKPVAPPRPKPPLPLRPVSLGVTRVETLRRDPYGVYAERILRLKPLAPLGLDPGARETGTYLHDLVATLARDHPRGPLPADALERLRESAREKFAALLARPEFRAFRWPRVETALGAIVDFENGRRGDLAAIEVEQSGRLSIVLSDGSLFTLTAQADRVERRHDGSLVILDFKTGQPPSRRTVAAGFAPQLTLEAAMIERGTFASIAAAPVADAVYVRLLAGETIAPASIVAKGTSLAEMVAEHFVELRKLLDEYRDPETPYLSRPYPQFVNEYSDYDHLARVREWSLGAGGGET